MEIFKDSTHEEKEALLNFPVYISLLTSNKTGKLDKAEKAAANELSHIKTFACNPLLVDFYKEADTVFEMNINLIDAQLPYCKDAREKMIKEELTKIYWLVLKLGEDYSVALHQSMKSFKEHASNTHYNVLVDFIFPLPLNGINYDE